MPERTEEGAEGEEAYQNMAEEAWRDREDLAERLRLHLQEEGSDPLLSTLADLAAQRLRLEADMRLLMAYGRCFTAPRPYKLIDLARATGLSISGVRIAFTDDEITQASEILRRPPVSDDGPVPAPE
jgi:AraC-like DNA-binding protein